MSLEGIVSKRADAPYTRGNWIGVHEPTRAYLDRGHRPAPRVPPNPKEEGTPMRAVRQTSAAL